MQRTYCFQLATIFILLQQLSLSNSDGSKSSEAEDFIQHVFAEFNNWMQPNGREVDQTSDEHHFQPQPSRAHLPLEIQKHPLAVPARVDYTRLTPIKNPQKISEPFFPSIDDFALENGENPLYPDSPDIFTDFEKESLTAVGIPIPLSETSQSDDFTEDNGENSFDPDSQDSFSDFEKESLRAVGIPIPSSETSESIDEIIHDSAAAILPPQSENVQYSEQEEIIYVRRTIGRPTLDIKNLLTHERQSAENIPITGMISSEATSNSQVDTCSNTNQLFNEQQTCSAGSQYHIQSQFRSRYTEHLGSTMHAYAKQSLANSSCDYTKRTLPRQSVNERSICPFYWNVSDRNPARIPEFLYNAECACYRPRLGYGVECKQLITKIRVLWKVGCNEGKHVYKEGWEKISVACVPVGVGEIHSKPLHSVVIPAHYPKTE